MEDKETVEEQLSVENVSNEVLLAAVLDKLQYDMVRDVLVKPLEPIKIKVVTNVPVETEEIDEETGEKVMAMEQQEQEFPSAFRTGVILALPSEAAYDKTLQVGMTIAYPHKYSIDFDLFKDSVLVKPYDIIAKVK